MNINILKKQIALSAEEEEFIEKKIRSLERFIKRFEEKGEMLLDIELSKTSQHHRKGEVYYAEVTMHLPKKTLRAEHFDTSIETAVDGVKDKLKSEILRYRELHVLRKR